MNKIIVSLACFVALHLAGCKEYNTPLDFGGDSISDTTYTLSTVPPAQQHNVLVEEFTGQSCTNCPAAHDFLRTQALLYPGRINVVALYIFGPIQSRPPHGSIHDFRDSIATQINSQVYNAVNLLPSGGVDRIAVSGQVSLGKDLWANAINTQLAIIDSINLGLETRHNAKDDLDTIIVKITYINQVSTKKNLSLVIVEDTMYDYQENGLHIDSGYLFTNVFRDMLTTVPGGVEIGTDRPVKEPGRVYQQIYTYKPKTLAAPNPPIKPKHCKVIAFVHNWGSGNYRIVQSANCPLRK